MSLGRDQELNRDKHTAKKILIVGPSWVGDMIMAQSLFKLIKQMQPQAKIDVLAPMWTFSLLSRMPEVSDAIALNLGHGELGLKTRYQLGLNLRQRDYDQAMVLPSSFKSALIPFFARIRQRTGWLGEMRFGVLNDIRYLDKQRYPRMIDQFMGLALAPNTSLPKEVPLPSFEINYESQQKTLAKHKPLWRGRPILALCPGAEFGPAKRWPADYYAGLAHAKITEGYDIWLFGSPRDRSITDEIMKLTAQQCENLAGRLELAETIDLLSLVTAVVSNDSGLMHVAAALHKPVIAIYGATSPTFTPPLSSQAHILQTHLACQPCFQRTCRFDHYQCLREIRPEQVLAALAQWNK